MNTANKSKDYTVVRVGMEKEPVVIVDRFSSQLDNLRQIGLSANYVPGGNHYPGMRAPAPPNYLGERADLLRDILINVFDMKNGADLIECSFSIVTTQPSKLTPIQRLPHFDGVDDKRLALLHYFHNDEWGGTSFFRHRGTGFETITEDRLASYDEALQNEVRANGLPEAKYFSGSSEQFEKIAEIESKPNRMIIYRGILLHSGNIVVAPNNDEGAGNARMTINTFLVGRS